MPACASDVSQRVHVFLENAPVLIVVRVVCI